MSLDHSHDFGMNGGVGDRSAQQGPLREAVGGRETSALAILTHTTSSQLDVCGAYARTKRDGAARFGTDVSIGARVERMAMACGRKHTRVREGEGNARQEHHAHTSRQRSSALIILHRTERRMSRRKSCRARRIHRDAWPIYAEYERNST
eukprot:scaffold65394_cov27-Tisochrysis_lutea.AAC.6